MSAILLAAALLVPDQGAFSMGPLTSTLSQDGVTRSERARAAHRRPGLSSHRRTPVESARLARQNCTGVLPRLRQRLGAGDPRIIKAYGMCRRLGYL